MNITIARGDQQYGPYTLDEVKSYLASGHLTYSDLAFREGATQWVPLSAITGAAPPPPLMLPKPSGQRSIGMLILMAFAWTMVFWFAGLFAAGAIAGAANPENAEQAGAAVGEKYWGIIFLAGLGLSVLLTIFGKLPGTKKQSP
jgi:hypothetical protein